MGKRGWVVELEARPTVDGHQRLAQGVRLIVERAASRQASKASERQARRRGEQFGEVGEQEVTSE
jgi:hypothetical protein